MPKFVFAQSAPHHKHKVKNLVPTEMLPVKVFSHDCDRLHAGTFVCSQSHRNDSIDKMTAMHEKPSCVTQLSLPPQTADRNPCPDVSGTAHQMVQFFGWQIAPSRLHYTAVRRARPLRRRFDKILRPFFVAIRARKPTLRARFLVEG